MGRTSGKSGMVVARNACSSLERTVEFSLPLSAGHLVVMELPV